MKLSLSWSMKRRICSSGTDSVDASGTAVASAVPVIARPATEIPARRSAARKDSAAARAGSRVTRPWYRARSTVSAESGADSLMKYHGFQPGAIRLASKNDSSPTICPLTRRMPCAWSCEASWRRSSVESIGSP